MEWMQSANAKLAKTSVSKVKRTFRQDFSMSDFPKGFRISKARLVNVFRKDFFKCNTQCNARVRRTTWYAMQHGVGEQNDMT